MAEEKLRTLEREREALEGRREVLQREKTAADDRLAAEEAEVDRLRASLTKARKEEEDALKEISDLTQRQVRQQNCSGWSGNWVEVCWFALPLLVVQDRAGDENDEDKFRVTMYRQMTGVRFGCPPADRPSEVSGYVSGRQPLKFLKTFRLDALESSPAFIGDYVWNLLHQAQADAWDWNISGVFHHFFYRIF